MTGSAGRLAVLALTALLMFAITGTGRAECPAVPPPDAAPAAAVPATRPPPWLARVTRLNRELRRADPELIFLGDSLTARWHPEIWQGYFGDRRAVNLGIDGDRTEHLLWRLQNGHLEGIRPKVAVIEIGSNNAAAGQPPEEIAIGVAAVVQELRRQLPELQILLLAIFPSGREPDARRRLSIPANRLIAGCDDGRQVHFLDINDRFLAADGRLPAEIAPDTVHLSRDGYEIWATAMEPALQRLLEAAH